MAIHGRLQRLTAGGYGPKRQRKVARRFERSYVAGVRHFTEDGTEADHELRLDNAPEMIREMIEDEQEDRGDWLEDGYLDELKRAHRSGRKAPL